MAVTTRTGISASLKRSHNGSDAGSPSTPASKKLQSGDSNREEDIGEYQMVEAEAEESSEDDDDKGKAKDPLFDEVSTLSGNSDDEDEDDDDAPIKKKTKNVGSRGNAILSDTDDSAALSRLARGPKSTRYTKGALADIPEVKAEEDSTESIPSTAGEGNGGVPAPVSQPGNDKKAVSNSADDGDAQKVPVPASGPTVGSQSSPKQPVFTRPDGVPLTREIQRRFAKLSVYTNWAESIFYIGQQGDRIEWSSNRVKDSRVILKTQVTPLRLWVLGQLTWNGMLAAGDSWPPKPKVAIKPLRDCDLVGFRNIVQAMSTTAKALDVSTIVSISAHADVAFRERGHNGSKANPFPHIYDAQNKNFKADKQGMTQLRPADLMRDDIVLLEVTVGRYWDETNNGRVQNWNSSRAYFHLEAVTLFVQGNDDGQDAEAEAAHDGNQSMHDFM